MDLDKFCYDAVKNYELESVEFKRFMKFRNWTLEDVMARHKKHEEKLADGVDL